MPIHDLELARSLHGALADIFVSNPAGVSNPSAMGRVSRLCDAIIAAVNDMESRVSVRAIESQAKVYFSSEAPEVVAIGSMSAAETLKYQMFNALSALRGRLDLLDQRPPSELELPAIEARRRLKVLVVEDNRDSAEAMRRLLEVCGYSVTVAHTAGEGLAAAQQVPPDVLLCDIGLPDHDGFTVADALREVKETRITRLIAVTAYGGEVDRQRARAAGFDLHLVKPVKPETLLQQLAEE